MAVEWFVNRIAISCLFFWARLVLRCRRPYIIGVTGSVGKTTTKDMIASVLMHPEAGPVVGVVGKTPRNMNDNIGLPFTVLGYEDFTYDQVASGRQWLAHLCRLPFRALALATCARFPKILVLEYAASTHGDVPRLAKLAPPTIAVVTTVGPGHLEQFKTVERVAQEKSALVRRVRPSGLVVLGADSPYASGMERETRARVIKVPGRGRELSKGIARVIARELGLADELITRALHDFQGPRGRLQTQRLGSLTVIDDSYNANPMSMELGLDTLAETAPPGARRVAILGMMVALGEESRQYHEAIGAYARRRADVLIGVGDLARDYQPDHWFEDSGECAEHLASLVEPGDCLLVKGSGPVRLHRVVQELERIGEALP
jgi:UDP-N-acetylmuramoyl-tripeptide--D-alanyl-D-alanine ligase